MKVIVLYEWPKAKPDIFKWAEEHDLYIDPTDNSWEVSTNTDDISILPIDEMEKAVCDKLVVFGSVYEIDLLNMSELLTVKGEK